MAEVHLLNDIGCGLYAITVVDVGQKNLSTEGWRCTSSVILVVASSMLLLLRWADISQQHLMEYFSAYDII